MPTPVPWTPWLLASLYPPGVVFPSSSRCQTPTKPSCFRNTAFESLASRAPGLPHFMMIDWSALAALICGTSTQTAAVRASGSHGSIACGSGFPAVSKNRTSAPSGRAWPKSMPLRSRITASG